MTCSASRNPIPLGSAFATRVYLTGWLPAKEYWQGRYERATFIREKSCACRHPTIGCFVLERLQQNPGVRAWPGTRRARPGERVGGLQVHGRRNDLGFELVDVVFYGLQIGREGPDDHLVHARVLEALEIVFGR